MSTGGYNASFEEAPTGFGSEHDPNDERKTSNHIDNTPLFGLDFKRHEDIKMQLESNKDGQKLEAMKILIGMIAKGKDCAHLFPSVVKNVVSKNQEIKKLVYVYLVRYAEEQQDLALLSISTFQKALKDPNQLIRASALRVLSSIRVPIIVPIMMLAIKESVTDMSPYVRKTAAHAIPKLYSLDPEQKDQLVEVIEKLLKDQTTLVAGSVVMAFETVCPERIDLIHKNYCKLCNLLVDVDEWGQVVILNMLTRYARTQFLDPNVEEAEDAPFYEEDGEEEGEESEEEESDDESESSEGGDEDSKKKKKKKKKKSDKRKKKKPYMMDQDHRLLLRNCKPLLQSRNAAVVMAVAQLYHHVAPRNEVGIVAKPLIRLLKGHREVQTVVLGNIATLSSQRPNMFEPYLKSFFVHSGDPTHIKLLKLDIIANVAGDTSIHTILREFRTYISSSDKESAAATIQAIGRVACNIPEVTETCLHGLVSLLSHKNEAVVAESVVVIKKLLQLQPKENKELIVQMAKLADSVKVPMAMASVLWLVGEYSSLIPKIAPDVLRKAAKRFPSQEDIVKLQTVNLAAKLFVVNPKQTKLLCQYVLSMAKYDQNYDIRDRARFLKQLVLPANEEGTAFSKYSKKILMSAKPVPVLESAYKGRSDWQLGSLSHFLGTDVTGYIPLPSFPKEAPDPSVRKVEDVLWGAPKSSSSKKKETFYEETSGSSSEEEEDSFYSSISGSEEESDEEKSGSGSEEEGSEEEGSEEDESEEDEDTSSEEGDVLENLKQRFAKSKPQDDSEETSEEEESEDSSEEEDESDSDATSSEEEPPRPKPKPKKTSTATKAAAASKETKQKQESKQPSLLSFDDWEDTAPSASAPAVSQPAQAMLVPLVAGASDSSLKDKSDAPRYQLTTPSCVPGKTYELLNRISGNGLSVTYSFTRKPHISSPKMVCIELVFQNSTDGALNGIELANYQLQSGAKVKGPAAIAQLSPGSAVTVSLGIDFNDTLQPAKFNICVGPEKKYPVQIDPQVGELIQPVQVFEQDFKTLQEKLTGMHENTGKVSMSSSPNADATSISKAVLEVANMGPVVQSTDSSVVRLAAVTFSSQVLVLVTVKLVGEGSSSVTVNCEKMVINSMLLKTIKETLSKI